MFPTFSLPPRKLWSASLAALCCCCGSAAAQNFSLQIADTNPLGIDAFVPGLDELGIGGGGAIKGDFDYGLVLDTVYNSNFRLTDTDEEGEGSIFFSPWLRYNSDPEGGAAVKFTAAYTPVVRTYFDNDELNEIDQSGELSLALRGSRTEINFFSRYNELSGTDRLSGDFVQGSLVTSGVRASRQIASRTWLNGGFSYGASDYESSGLAGSDLYSTYIGGRWIASERLSLGPSLRYNVLESDNSGSRDAWALLADIRYQAGNRFWITASIGPEYASYSGNGNDGDNVNLSMDLSAAYVIDPRWTWTNTVRTAVVGSPTDTGYVVNDYEIQSIVYRNLTRGFAYGGLEFHLSEYEDAGAATVIRDDDFSYGIVLGYQRPVISERVQFDARLRYAINEGDTDWEQLLISAGLRVEF